MPEQAGKKNTECQMPFSVVRGKKEKGELQRMGLYPALNSAHTMCEISPSSGHDLILRYRVEACGEKGRGLEFFLIPEANCG
jgi:hypothetical protein